MHDIDDMMDGIEVTERMRHDLLMQEALMREHPERFTADYSAPGTRSPRRLVPTPFHSDLKSGIDG